MSVRHAGSSGRCLIAPDPDVNYKSHVSSRHAWRAGSAARSFTWHVRHSVRPAGPASTRRPCRPDRRAAPRCGRRPPQRRGAALNHLPIDFPETLSVELTARDVRRGIPGSAYGCAFALAGLSQRAERPCSGKSGTAPDRGPTTAPTFARTKSRTPCPAREALGPPPRPPAGHRPLRRALPRRLEGPGLRTVPVPPPRPDRAPDPSRRAAPTAHSASTTAWCAPPPPRERAVWGVDCLRPRLRG